MTESAARGNRKVRTGRVLSAEMDKTIVVQVERRIRHPLYGKEVKKYKKFYVHDEENKAAQGDLVRISETRPVSKTKNWRLIEVMEHQD